MDKKFLSEGEFLVTNVPMGIITILGSCVAVCLWDKKLKIGGINHYLLPIKNEEDITNSNRGEIAIPLIIKLMLERNCEVENMEAKIFGGCNSQFSNSIYEVGKKNIEIAYQILNSFNIKVKAKDVGGEFGRKIIFNPYSGQVLMKLLKKLQLKLTKKLIKVLVCDDSALVRQTLSDIINSDPALTVIGTAADPYFAAKKIKSEIPDVITLDLEMPRMDGLTFLKTLMSQYPIPVILISSLTEKGSYLAIKALELGAVEIICKSEIRNTEEHINETKIRITDAIKAAFVTPVKKLDSNKTIKEDGVIIKPNITTTSINYKTTDKVIAIGASTGGTEAIRFILKNISVTSPGILITQHMPAGFTKSFADQLNTICQITIKEAIDGEKILLGHAYIAPGGKHMELYKSGVKYHIRIRDGDLVNRHKPSVDVLFNSVAKHAGQNALGIILTGMGRDGADGLLNMKDAGSRTIAQDEKSCIVFGMPKEAIKIGAADQILSLKDIPQRLLGYH